MEYEKYNKLVNTTKKIQTHRYKEQTSGYQWGRDHISWGNGRYKPLDIKQAQEYTVQHGEYRQYFLITITFKIVHNILIKNKIL